MTTLLVRTLFVATIMLLPLVELLAWEGAEDEPAPSPRSRIALLLSEANR